MNKKNLLGIVLVIATTTFSENFIAYKVFKKPYKPYKFNTPFEENKFFRDVEIYKAEIGKYIEEQDDAIRRHHAAREDAMEQWNDFAKYQLEDPSKQMHKK